MSFDGAVRRRESVARPDRYRQIEQLPPDAPRTVRGGGYSYAPASFGARTTVQETRAFNRVLGFDPEKGILECEAGLTLAQLHSVAAPHGWYLPGTARLSSDHDRRVHRHRGPREEPFPGRHFPAACPGARSLSSGPRGSPADSGQPCGSLRADLRRPRPDRPDPLRDTRARPVGGDASGDPEGPARTAGGGRSTSRAMGSEEPVTLHMAQPSVSGASFGRRFLYTGDFLPGPARDGGEHFTPITAEGNARWLICPRGCGGGRPAYDRVKINTKCNIPTGFEMPAASWSPLRQEPQHPRGLGRNRSKARR